MSVLAARLGALVIAAVSLFWVYLLSPIAVYGPGSDLVTVGRGLQALGTYDQDLLERLDAEASEKLTQWPCQPDELESLVLVRVAVSAPFFLSSELEDKRAAALERVKDGARLSLACNPNSTTSWTMLGWAELLTSGDSDVVLSYFDMSYATGPMEYLAALRRVELAITLWDDLDDPHRKLVADHMRLVVEAKGYMFAAGFYASMPDDAQKMVRDAFAEHLDEVDQKRIEAAIWSMDATIELPLVPPRGSRPWR